MNKKTLRIAGWALGLSMAVAGIGAAVGASYVASEGPLMVKAATTTDTLTSGELAATGTTYTAFSNVSGDSGAVYAGQSAKDGSGNIQLRSKNSNSGIVSTASGGTIKSVTITVGSGSNTVDIYGSNSAYTSASDLYDAEKQGTKIGSTSTTKTISVSGDYAYVGIRSNNGALYLSSVAFEWDAGGSSTTTYNVTNSVSNASISGTGKVAEDAALNLTFTANEHYTLPSSVSVTIGGSPYLGHTYTRNEGNRTASFSVPSGVIKGDVVISGDSAEDPKYTITYTHDGNGSGDDYVVTDQYGGVYTLVPFISTGFLANGGYLFDHYDVSGTPYKPGDSITVSSDVTVTAVFSALPGSVIIDENTLAKVGSGSGYGPYDGTRSVDGYNISTNNVMINSHKVQFRKSTSAYMYNETAFVRGIRMLRTVGSTTLNVSFDDDTVGSGNGSIGSVVTAITIGEVNYYIPTISNAKYFHIVSQNTATDYIDSIEVLDSENAAVAFAEMYLGAYSCNANGMAEPSLNEGYTKVLIQTLYNAFACSGDTVQNLLQSAADNHTSDYGVDKVKEFGERYYWIVRNHYAADGDYDFMGRVAAGKISAANRTSIENGASSVKLNSVVVITAIAGVGLASAAGFAFLRRKKEDR